MSHSRLHNIWLTMRYRCEKPNSSTYHKYGAKGIKVCNEWSTSFECFRDWSIANGYTDTLTIDRIDPKGNYEPANCRWVTQKEQQNNRTNNIKITYKNVTKSMIEWSNTLNIPIRILYGRYYLGWTVERMFEQPVRKSYKKRCTVYRKNNCYFVEEKEKTNGI